MSEVVYPTGPDDTELAELVADIGERLRRGETHTLAFPSIPFYLPPS